MVRKKKINLVTSFTGIEEVASREGAVSYQIRDSEVWGIHCSDKRKTWICPLELRDQPQAPRCWLHRSLLRASTRHSGPNRGNCKFSNAKENWIISLLTDFKLISFQQICRWRSRRSWWKREKWSTLACWKPARHHKESARGSSHHCLTNLVVALDSRHRGRNRPSLQVHCLLYSILSKHLQEKSGWKLCPPSS